MIIKKKLFVLFFTALLPYDSFSQKSFKKQMSTQSNLLGTIPYHWKSAIWLMPNRIWTTKDGSLFSTSFQGGTSPSQKGLIWKAKPNENKLFFQKIDATLEQHYGGFTTAVLDPRNENRLFSCSVFTDKKTAHSYDMSLNQFSTIIVFEKNLSGFYQWKKVINFSNHQNERQQWCNKLAISERYLLALNSYKKNNNSPAIEYLALEETKKLAEEMKIAATYGQIAPSKKEENLVITDFNLVKKQDNKQTISLFVLNQLHKKIEKVRLIKTKQFELKFEQVTQSLDLPDPIKTPITMANYNDTSFIVSSFNITPKTSSGQIDQVIYQKKGVEVIPIAQFSGLQSIITGLSIGNDRFGITSDQVVFANLLSKKESDPYAVLEYRFKN